MREALSFAQVTKRFGTVCALENVSFSVSPGEFFGLVGVNGAGKTTLIKCLLDFASLDGGIIEICGISHRLPVSRQQIIFLPERFTPPHYLSGRDFFDMMRRLHAASFGAAEIADMLRQLDFDPGALGKPVRSLSKGMTQKLGLAGVLLVQKPVYILDEPMSGLDPKARALLKAKLSAMKRAGCTVFFTSHQLIDVDELADRLAILHAGQLRFCGTPDELRARYQQPTLEGAFLASIA